jgi:hypothetical protein
LTDNRDLRERDAFHKFSSQQPDPPAAMFSAPGHRDTVWSDVKGSVAHSRMIRWAGGVAASHAIDRVSGATEVRTRSVELHFSWNAGVAGAEAESGKRVWVYKNNSLWLHFAARYECGIQNQGEAELPLSRDGI